MKPRPPNDNIHEVIVRATDDAYDIEVPAGDMAPSKATTKTVTVMVTNVEEPGKVTLTVNGTDGQPVLQPQMGVVLTATLTDGDTATDIEWQWYQGSTKIIGAKSAAYTPAQGYIGEQPHRKGDLHGREELQRQGHGRGHDDHGGASRS